MLASESHSGRRWNQFSCTHSERCIMQVCGFTLLSGRPQLCVSHPEDIDSPLWSTAIGCSSRVAHNIQRTILASHLWAALQVIVDCVVNGFSATQPAPVDQHNYILIRLMDRQQQYLPREEPNPNIKYKMINPSLFSSLPLSSRRKVRASLNCDSSHSGTTEPGTMSVSAAAAAPIPSRANALERVERGFASAWRTTRWQSIPTRGALSATSIRPCSERTTWTWPTSSPRGSLIPFGFPSNLHGR